MSRSKRVLMATPPAARGAAATAARAGATPVGGAPTCSAKADARAVVRYSIFYGLVGATVSL